MPRVKFITIGDKNTASSRLIVLENVKYLQKLGWNVSVNQGDSSTFDILVFQKRFRAPDCRTAGKARSKIVFQLSEADYLKGGWGPAILAFAKQADAIVVGSRPIQRWFKKHHLSSVIIPTGLDFAALPKRQKKLPVKICWIGSTLNERYLRHVVDPLNELWKKYNFELRIIGGRRPHLPFEGKRHFLKWKLGKAESWVSECHIGIAPLDCKPFEFAKPPSKPVLYMAQGLAVVATETPVYRELIKDKVSGFLIHNNDEARWIRVLALLLTNARRRNSIVAAGSKACQRYNAPHIAKQWDAFLRTLL